MGLLDMLGGFGTTPPSYLEGLLGAQATEDLRKRSIGSGIINALVGYAAAPKNQELGLGRILASAAQQGMQGARGVYDQAGQDLFMQQRIDEMKRTQARTAREDERQVAQDLFRSNIGKPNATRDVFTQDAMQVPVAQGADAPSFATQLPAPTVTQEQFYDPKVMLNEGLRSGAISLDKFLEITSKVPDSPFAKPNITDLDPASIARYKQTGDITVLRALPKEPKEKDLTAEPSRVAKALFDKDINDLTQTEMLQLNNFIDDRKLRVARESAPKPPSQMPSFADATPIRKEYQDNPVVKAFDKQDSAFKIIKATMTKPSAAGDLAGTTKFMKLLDPESVVRESEFGLARNATGLYDKMTNYYDQITKGTVLTPRQRKDFLDTAREFYDIAAESKLNVQNQYIDIARTGGLDPKLIVGSPTAINLPNGVTVKRVR